MGQLDTTKAPKLAWCVFEQKTDFDNYWRNNVKMLINLSVACRVWKLFLKKEQEKSVISNPDLVKHLDGWVTKESRHLRFFMCIWRPPNAYSHLCACEEGARTDLGDHQWASACKCPHPVTTKDLVTSVWGCKQQTQLTVKSLQDVGESFCPLRKICCSWEKGKGRRSLWW